MRHTQLYDKHKAMGARLTDFHGWEMPLEYAGVVHEHEAVRKAAGLFDISHMGVIEVGGGDSLAFLRRVLTLRPGAMNVDSSKYSFILNERGGIIDDLIAYRLNDERFLLVVNAAAADKDLAWLRSKSGGLNAIVIDDSPDTAILALQGPASWDVVRDALGIDPASFKYGTFINSTFEGTGYILSKTGYTGERGFELFIHNHTVEKLWDALIEAGRTKGLMPCGLGARDTLRLEMGYLLSGVDTDEDTTPLEAGYARVVDFENEEFTGRDALMRQREAGPGKTLTGLRLIENGVPRHGCRILAGGSQVGTVTSGNFSPMLKTGIALGYISSGAPVEGLSIEIHDKTHSAEIVELPFYKKK